MDRRKFTRLCSSLVAGASSLSLASRAAIAASENQSEAASDTAGVEVAGRKIRSTQLVFPNGAPVTADSLAEGTAYIFHFPFKSTPGFLIRLRSDARQTSDKSSPVTLTDKNGRSYQWAGGVGPGNAIVAFSAICTHKMSHPAKPVSHLNFRPEDKVYYDRQGQQQNGSQLIYCCSEHSVYDPFEGARVLSGPASQPLASIGLTIDKDDSLYADSLYGGDMLEQFVEKFGFRQAIEQNLTDPYETSGPTTSVVPADEFSAMQILC